MIEKENSVRNSFSKLSLEHEDLIKMAFKKSDEITNLLEFYYDSEKIKSFNTFEDFLDDINSMLETNSFSKPKFIRKIQENYFTV
jgi:hypothetical protein